MIQIKRGVTRTVVLVNKYAIKFPTLQSYKLFLNGLLANLQEKEFNGSHPDLAPIIFSLPFGFCNIMVRADELNVKDLSESEFRDFLLDKYKNDPLKEFMLSDAKSTNWGTLKGKLVKIDYGS